MSLFRKNEKRKGSKNDMLSEEIFGYMQSEGFFPEMEEKDKDETDVSRIHFKFQGTNVTLEVTDGNYIRIGMVFDLSQSDTDYFNLQCAASQIMFEIKAVKIIAAVKWIQFSVETFVQTAEAFTPFLKTYLDILSEAVGRPGYYTPNSWKTRSLQTMIMKMRCPLPRTMPWSVLSRMR